MRYAILGLASSAAVLFFAGCFQRTTAPGGPSIPSGSSESDAVATTSGSDPSSASVPSDEELDAFAKQERRVWRYDDGKHPMNQEGTPGRFVRQESGAWRHVIDRYPGESRFPDLKETARTEAYVELAYPDDLFVYRLYDDRGEFRYGNQPEVEELAVGRWIRPEDPREIAETVAARSLWRYERAPQVFPDQTSFAGLFRRNGDVSWTEVRVGAPSTAYNETARNDQYVEIATLDDSVRVRLFVDRSEFRYGNEREFKPMFPGNWAGDESLPEPGSQAASPPSGTEAATTSPAQTTVDLDDGRTRWRYENAPVIFPDQGGVVAGSFRREPSGAWEEERVGGTDGPRDWVETARTEQYVELSRPDGGYFVRLYADRSEYRYGNETEFKPMFPGEWDDDGKLPAAAN